MMGYPVVVEQFAKKDIREAMDWLEEQKPGLGEQFRNELEIKFDRIAANPLAYAIVERRTRQVRLPLQTYVVSYILFLKTRYM